MLGGYCLKIVLALGCECLFWQWKFLPESLLINLICVDNFYNYTIFIIVWTNEKHLSCDLELLQHPCIEKRASSHLFNNLFQTLFWSLKQIYCWNDCIQAFNALLSYLNFKLSYRYFSNVVSLGSNVHACRDSLPNSGNGLFSVKIRGKWT